MSKAKPPEQLPSPQMAAFVKRMLLGETRSLVWSAIFVLAFMAGVYGLWRNVQSNFVDQEEYRISAKQIEVSPRPEWVKTDVVADALSGLSLEGSLNLLDAQLSKRLYDAFAVHPWVEKVQRVTKQYPARVQVDLVYRRPVCMVEVVGSPRAANGQVLPGELLPVDEQGVLLPAGDFPLNVRLQYPRLAAIASSPHGPAGTPWGDPRVHGGAEVAQAVSDVWREFNFTSIVPSAKAESGPSKDEFSFEINTASGTRIIWGLRPTTEMPGEVAAAEKINRLRRHISESGSRTSSDIPQVIDLRGWHNLTVRPARGDELHR